MMRGEQREEGDPVLLIVGHGSGGSGYWRQPRGFEQGAGEERSGDAGKERCGEAIRLGAGQGESMEKSL